MKTLDFKDKKVTVMGLGRFLQGSGVGVTKWLIRHGAQTIITDLKTEQDLKESMDEVMYWFDKYQETYPDREFYRPIFVMGEHKAEHFSDVDYVVQNPGVPRESEFVDLARKNNVPILSDISIFYKLCPFPFIAITGAKGKSTTTSMVGDIFLHQDARTVVAGNIKVSPLEHLDSLLDEDEEPHPIVLELSSWLLESLGDVDRSADIAVVTNLYPDHLNRYDSFEHYKKAKEMIFTNQKPSQYTILNYDQEVVREMSARVPGKVVWFSKHPVEGNAVYVRGQVFIFYFKGKEEEIMRVDQLGALGEHNLENALAAIAVAKLSNVPNEHIVEALSGFKGIPDRQEIIDESRGVTYVNDTTATAPAGTVAALRRFRGEGSDARKGVILLAGGASKELPFEIMVEEVGKTCKFVVLFDGEATDELEQMLGDSVPTERVSSMQQAVQVAASKAESGDVVLLSPGCASFGMFKNEFDRGDQFKEQVAKL